MKRRAFVAAAGPVLLPLRLRAADADRVTVGITNSISDAPLLIGFEKGFFREQGLDVVTTAFASAGPMVAPLGKGDLDVAAGGPSAALFNAIAQGVDVKVVASKGSSPQGYGYGAIVVRKALVESGRVRGLKDLKGLKMGESAKGTSSFVLVVDALKLGGLTFHDIEEVFLSFPDLAAGLTSGAIDAAQLVEPFTSQLVDSGVAVSIAGSDVTSPNYMSACILYGAPFANKRHAIAQRFMLGYLKAARYYHDALKNGRLAGPTGPDVIAILTKYTAIKDPAVFRRIVPSSIDPNGFASLASMRKSLAAFSEAGMIQGTVTAEQAVDNSFVVEAVRVLGPYHPRI